MAAEIQSKADRSSSSRGKSLKLRTLAASAWVVSGSAAGNVLRLLANLAVTRLLFPDAFGLMLIASTVQFIVAMLSDVGIQQSIVGGPRGEDPVFLDTAWSLQIVRGVVMWLVAIAFAAGLAVAVGQGWVPASSTYANPDLPWVIAASTFTAVLYGFSATDVASSNRRMNMKPVLMWELSSQIISIALMVLFAWWLKSVWALVCSGLLGVGVQVAMSHRFFGIHRNRFHFDRAALAELIGFGKWIAVSSAATAFAANGDRIVLAALVGANALGMYSVAIALAGALDMVVQVLFSRVMLPALSEVARNQLDRLPATFIRLRWRIDPLLLFASGALFALGPLVIDTLYDSRYRDAGLMLQILSLGLAVSRFALVQQVYLALNEPRYLVVLNGVRLVSVYSLVPLAFYGYGLQGALVAIALKDLPTVPLIFMFNARHRLNNFFLEVGWLAFWPVGYAVGLAVLTFRGWFGAHG